MSNIWKNHGSFWELLAKQGSDMWLRGRVGRVTGSVSGALAGKSNFKTVDEIGKIISGVTLEEFSDKSLEAMDHGHTTEPVARDWYSNKYNVKVVERGLCVPKWDLNIGASVDGDIIDTVGIIEIKCPIKMYRPITQYIEAKENGWVPSLNFMGHIYETHYAQMQHSMAVLGKQWCDYIVYSTSDNKIFTQRVPFNSTYWSNELYPTIKENYNHYVKPDLPVGYPLTP